MEGWIVNEWTGERFPIPVTLEGTRVVFGDPPDLPVGPYSLQATDLPECIVSEVSYRATVAISTHMANSVTVEGLDSRPARLDTACADWRITRES